MAQVMQWPPAICNYMRKARFLCQHDFSITDSKFEYKKIDTHAHAITCVPNL